MYAMHLTCLCTHKVVDTVASSISQTAAANEAHASKAYIATATEPMQIAGPTPIASIASIASISATEPAGVEGAGMAGVLIAAGEGDGAVPLAAETETEILADRVPAYVCTVT